MNQDEYEYERQIEEIAQRTEECEFKIKSVLSLDSTDDGHHWEQLAALAMCVATVLRCCEPDGRKAARQHFQRILTAEIRADGKRCLCEKCQQRKEAANEYKARHA